MDDKLARAKKLVGRIRWILEMTEEENIVDGEDNGFAKEKVVESEEESLVSKPEMDVISEKTGEYGEGDGLK